MAQYTQFELFSYNSAPPPSKYYYANPETVVGYYPASAPEHTVLHLASGDQLVVNATLEVVHNKLLNPTQ